MPNFAFVNSCGMILFFVLVGALFIGLAVPLILRRMPPNSFDGLRVSATVADEWVWYEANARSGWDLLWLGVELVWGDASSKG